MKMTNNEIYNRAAALIKDFGPNSEIKLPIKVSFFLQKNLKTLTELAQDIEQARTDIAQRYGELSEDGSYYTVPDEHMDEAAQELNDLFGLEQDVNIHVVSIDSFSEDLMLTAAQMDALMFMVE